MYEAASFDTDSDTFLINDEFDIAFSVLKKIYHKIDDSDITLYGFSLQMPQGSLSLFHISRKLVN